tara:strand:- start:31 stop:2739 length:2709 start_codon:yes stop_codon:yes gene_type:complete
MADTRGVWGLSETWAEKSAAEWVPLPNVWVIPAISKENTGYIGGGSPAANVDKLNFSNDTKTGLGYNVFPGNPRKSGAVGGNTHGYIGGKHPGYENYINKMVYATDAGSAIPATLSAGRGYLAGCNSETNGYFVGGAGSFNSYVSIVDRITHATDTCQRIPSADLPSANRKQSLMATTAAPGAAYIGGGVSPATTAVSKLTFSTEASAQIPGAAMITARGYATCTSNGTNTYWYGGSSNNNGSVQTTDIDKTVFASDTTTNIPANMPTHYNVRAAATGNTTFGVIAGGYSPGPAISNQAFKFTYGNESVATAPGFNLSNGKKEASGFSARNGFTGTTYAGTTARWSDGYTGAADTVLFDGSNDYLSITGWDSDSRLDAAALTWECWVKFTGSDGTLETIWESRSSTSADNGFLIGRFHTSGHENKIEMYSGNTYRITTDVTVANDVWTHVAYSKDGGNSEARIYINGTEAGSWTDGYNYDNTGTFYVGRNVSNSHKMYGYITNMRYVKGQSLYTSNFTVPTEPLTSTSQGATASNVKLLCCNSSDIEDSTVLASGLSISESGFSSTDSSSQLGIFAGAPTATPTSSTTLSGPEGLKLEGYIGKGRQSDQPSGNDGRTDLTKFSYSTETWSSSASGNMPNGKKFPGATSNTTRGYWAGGTPGNSSIVDKFVWSTNTGSTIPATLGSARSYASSAAGNQTQGYFTFGDPGTYQNACDKLVYSNETMSNLPSMPFKSARAVAISMQTAGYYGSGAGQDDKGSYFTKITFATDTKSGNLPGWRAHSSGSNMFRSGSSSSTKAYVCSGESTTRAMEATPWATDSVSQLPTTFLPADATGTKGQGDNTNAYFTGGPGPSGGSLTQRVVYSSDTVSVLPGANFPGGKVSAYGAGGPGMNGIANSVPNVI